MEWIAIGAALWIACGVVARGWLLANMYDFVSCMCGDQADDIAREWPGFVRLAAAVSLAGPSALMAAVLMCLEDRVTLRSWRWR